MAGRLTLSAGQPGLGDKPVDGVGDCGWIRRIFHDETGLAVDYRFGRTTAFARHRGIAGRGRLEEYDPESLLLQAPPTGPAAQREHVSAGVQAGQVAVLGPGPSRRTGAPVLLIR